MSNRSSAKHAARRRHVNDLGFAPEPLPQDAERWIRSYCVSEWGNCDDDMLSDGLLAYVELLNWFDPEVTTAPFVVVFRTRLRQRLIDGFRSRGGRSSSGLKKERPVSLDAITETQRDDILGALESDGFEFDELEEARLVLLNMRSLLNDREWRVLLDAIKGVDVAETGEAIGGVSPSRVYQMRSSIKSRAADCYPGGYAQAASIAA